MRIAVVCPGRGTYTRTELGSLSRPLPSDLPGVREQWLDLADGHRKALGRRTVRELDQATAFTSAHLAGENAAALILTGAMIDAAHLDPAHEVVAVAGNSMGWYIALAVAGAIEAKEAFRLVDAMGGQQLYGVIGGQLLYPLVDEDWRPSPERAAELAKARQRVRDAGLVVYDSIRLGGLAVLAGDEAALGRLEAELPKIEFGRRAYPFRLLGHSAFHTPLLQESSVRGQAELHDLALRAPAVPLIDGRGHAHRPHSASARDLINYTLTTQVVETYDFALSIQVILRDYAPDALVLLGPGDTLGGSLAQILIAEGYQGLRSRADFQARQASERPVILALAREEQRLRVVRR